MLCVSGTGSNSAPRHTPALTQRAGHKQPEQPTANEIHLEEKRRGGGGRGVGGVCGGGGGGVIEGCRYLKVKGRAMKWGGRELMRFSSLSPFLYWWHHLAVLSIPLPPHQVL